MKSNMFELAAVFKLLDHWERARSPICLRRGCLGVGTLRRQDRDERRKLIDLIASNCTLKDGVVEVFAILADGVAKEAEMGAAGASKEAIEKEWLPK